ncbi:unnamed protein product [Paramecium sonneborni]|uniref:Uncharacterized protein n=1 Tax=Paramecium sonneborni TaxID=65129 RepID=A0A8S1NQR9_9CILI|nr:unnamed protein product [Paramecium sonneborni]
MVRIDNFMLIILDHLIVLIKLFHIDIFKILERTVIIINYKMELKIMKFIRREVILSKLIKK